MSIIRKLRPAVPVAVPGDLSDMPAIVGVAPQCVACRAAGQLTVREVREGNDLTLCLDPCACMARVRELAA